MSSIIEISVGDSTLLNDHPECQIDPLADSFLGLRNLVLPKLLHRPFHDDERAVADLEAPRLLRLVVPNAKCPGGSQRQGTDDVAHLRLVIGVHSHAVRSRPVTVQQTVIVLALDRFNLLLDLYIFDFLFTYLLVVSPIYSHLVILA